MAAALLHAGNAGGPLGGHLPPGAAHPYAHPGVRMVAAGGVPTGALPPPPALPPMAAVAAHQQQQHMQEHMQEHTQEQQQQQQNRKRKLTPEEKQPSPSKKQRSCSPPRYHGSRPLRTHLDRTSRMLDGIKSYATSRGSWFPTRANR